MKGAWVYEPAKDQWHLIWDDAATVKDGVVAWCGFRAPEKDAVTKPGDQINGLFESVHDECCRKSGEL